MLDLGNDLLEGTFIARPNRFTAEVEVDGGRLRAYFCNPGRMTELAVPGASALLKPVSAKSARTTAYDLMALKHNGIWVTVDSRLPNHIFRDLLEEGLLQQFVHPEVIRPEFRLGHSRFDFYLEMSGRPCLVEVKGCTLQESGIALFPDAPTLRGARHVEELGELQSSYDCWLAVVIQRPDVRVFTTHDAMDPAFGRAVRKSRARKVGILALRTSFDGRFIRLEGPVPVDLALAADIASRRRRETTA